MNSTDRLARLAARLFEARGADLLRYLRQRVRSDADARDIAQESYLRFIRLGDPDRIDNPEAYLFRIAGNLLWEHRLRERGASEQTPLDETPVSEDTPFDLTVLAQNGARMRTVLDALPALPRAVLVLHLRDGLTCRQIGDQAGISASMVKKHLNKALTFCRWKLRDI